VTLTWPWTVAAMVGEELTWHSSKYLSNVTNRQPPKIRGLGRRIRGGTLQIQKSRDGMQIKRAERESMGSDPLTIRHGCSLICVRKRRRRRCAATKDHNGGGVTPTPDVDVGVQSPCLHCPALGPIGDRTRRRWADLRAGPVRRRIPPQRTR